VNQGPELPVMERVVQMDRWRHPGKHILLGHSDSSAGTSLVQLVGTLVKKVRSEDQREGYWISITLFFNLRQRWQAINARRALKVREPRLRLEAEGEPELFLAMEKRMMIRK